MDKHCFENYLPTFFTISVSILQGYITLLPSARNRKYQWNWKYQTLACYFTYLLYLQTLACYFTYFYCYCYYLTTFITLLLTTFVTYYLCYFNFVTGQIDVKPDSPVKNRTSDNPISDLLSSWNSIFQSQLFSDLRIIFWSCVHIHHFHPFRKWIVLSSHISLSCVS